MNFISLIILYNLRASRIRQPLSIPSMVPIPNRPPGASPGPHIFLRFISAVGQPCCIMRKNFKK